MSKVKITEQDVGRSYIGRDGREYEILSFSEKSVYQFTVGIKEQALETIAANGKASLIDELCGADFKEWAYKDEKMENKIELKVGQKVKMRNGDIGEVYYYCQEDEHDNQPFEVHNSTMNEGFYYSKDGTWGDNKESDLDIVEILEEPKEEDMEENLKEKYSKLVGQTFIVKEEDDDDEITITSVSESFVFFNSKNYEDKYNATFEDFEKMKIRKKTQQEKLTEKYEKLINRRFKNEDGDVVTITSVDVENDSVLIKFNDDDQEYSSTLNDIDERLENAEEVTGQQEEADLWDDEEVAEEQDKYELRLTVVDAKGSATTDKSYHDSLADVDGYVFSNTRGVVDLDQPNSDYSVLRFLLRAKSDVVKITRQINILNVNIATITIRVTNLED